MIIAFKKVEDACEFGLFLSKLRESKYSVQYECAGGKRVSYSANDKMSYDDPKSASWIKATTEIEKHLKESDYEIEN